MMLIRLKIYCIHDKKFLCDKIFHSDCIITSMTIEGNNDHVGHGIFTFYATYPKGVNISNPLQCWKCLQSFSSQQNRDWHQFNCNGTKSAVTSQNWHRSLFRVRICTQVFKHHNNFCTFYWINFKPMIIGIHENSCILLK